MKLIDLDEFLRQNCIDRMDGKSCEECKYHVLEVSCERLMEQPTIDAVEVVRCNQCKFYEGVHNVPGCAPCAFWGIGGVMWDDFCKRGERWDG